MEANNLEFKVTATSVGVEILARVEVVGVDRVAVLVLVLVSIVDVSVVDVSNSNNVGLVEADVSAVLAVDELVGVDVIMVEIGGVGMFVVVVVGTVTTSVNV